MNAAPTPKKSGPNPTEMRRQAVRDAIANQFLLIQLVFMLLVAVFYGILLFCIIGVRSEMISYSNHAPYSFSLQDLNPAVFLVYALLILIGDFSQIKQTLGSLGQLGSMNHPQANQIYNSMMTLMDLLIVLTIVALLIRLIPVIASLILYIKSKKYHSLESMKKYFMLLKVFGIIEIVVWSLIGIYFIISQFKNGFSLPENDRVVMYFCLFLLTITCKILQGVFMIRYLRSVKRYIQDEILLERSFALKLSSVLLCTCFSIVLYFILFDNAKSVGWEGLKASFQYFWKIYLFLAAYLLSNGFLVSYLMNALQRLRQTEFAIESGLKKKDFSQDFPAFNPTPSGNTAYRQNSYPQNHFRQSNSYPQNNPQAFVPKDSNVSSTGSGFSSQYDDIFGFKTHDDP